MFRALRVFRAQPKNNPNHKKSSRKTDPRKHRKRHAGGAPKKLQTLTNVGPFLLKNRSPEASFWPLGASWAQGWRQQASKGPSGALTKDSWRPLGGPGSLLGAPGRKGIPPFEGLSWVWRLGGRITGGGKLVACSSFSTAWWTYKRN